VNSLVVVVARKRRISVLFVTNVECARFIVRLVRLSSTSDQTIRRTTTVVRRSVVQVIVPRRSCRRGGARGRVEEEMPIRVNCVLNTRQLRLRAEAAINVEVGLLSCHLACIWIAPGGRRGRKALAAHDASEIVGIVVSWSADGSG
jgi:hypothetical protein